MKTLLVTTPQAKIEAKTVRELIPGKLRGWHIQALPSGSLNQTVAFPDVTLVQLNNETRPAEIKAMIHELVHIQTRAPKRSYVLFSVNERGVKVKLRERPAQQRHFRAVVTQINAGLRDFPNPDYVGLTFDRTASDLAVQLDHIRAKLDLPVRVVDVNPPRPSTLDQVKEVVKATEDLREANGNLSAASVASVFGISLNQLAGWLNRTRQALSKTPDADSLQNELAFFERTARLRAVVPKEGFQKWLRMANPELDDKTPLALLANGEWQVVADLVDDMLTGVPA